MKRYEANIPITNTPILLLLTSFLMDSRLLLALDKYGFGEKEAKVYLTILELGNSIASTIARRAEINRATTYSILLDLKRRGIVNETSQNNIKYYSAIAPEVLFKKREDTYESMKADLPALLAVSNKFGNRPKTQFYEGLEGLKKIFEQVIIAGKTMDVPYLTFVGAAKMDPALQKYLNEDFIVKRMKIKTKTKAIVSKGDSAYVSYHKKNHNTLVVDKPLFKLGNEIVVYGGDKTAIMMYDTDEMSGLIIESKTLHDGLTSLFNLIWDVYKTKKK